VSAALTAFSRGGYVGTTVADVASEAGISSAYALKLFGGKEALFVAALDKYFERIEETLSTIRTMRHRSRFSTRWETLTPTSSRIARCS